MNTKKGIGLIGMLLAVLLIGILMTVLLKQYASQTQRLRPALKQTDEAAWPAEAPLAAPAGEAAAPAPCDGKRVGNLCIPTQLQSGSLDAFEQLDQ